MSNIGVGGPTAISGSLDGSVVVKGPTQGSIAVVDPSDGSIEGPESRTGRALENAYKYCPSRNVTRQISKWEN